MRAWISDAALEKDRLTQMPTSDFFQSCSRDHRVSTILSNSLVSNIYSAYDKASMGLSVVAVRVSVSATALDMDAPDSDFDTEQAPGNIACQ